MKKLISIMAVVCILIFSCVPAFAEDFYSMDLVPYSPYINGLQVTDNDIGVVYKSALRSSPAFSASATSDVSADSVYYFKDIVAFKGTGVTPNPDTLPSVIKIVNNSAGYRGYVFQQKSDSFYEQYSSFRTNPQQLPKLRATNKYHVTFSMRQSENWGAYSLYLYDSTDSSKVIYLSKKDFSTSIGINSTFDMYVTIPESWTGIPTIRFEATQLKNSDVYYSIYINDLTFSDVTNENLDKAIDKGVDKIENAGSDQPALDTDISAFQTAIDTMNGWIDQLNEFADSIDSAGETASAYIAKGTELFNGFMGVAPASVIALIAFGIVFLVIRKIVGR